MRASSRLLTAVATSVILLFGCRKADDAPVVDEAAVPPLRVVLPFSEARVLFTACDGKTTSADSLWMPPDSVLRALEARLSQHLGTSSPRSSGGDPLRRYSRQYLGLYRGERKLVFVNGVHQTYLDRAVEWDSGGSASQKVARVEQRFREFGVRVCDGGKAFFRAEYDVGADRISAFEFNEFA